MHLERGFEVTGHLQRIFDLCKSAVTRGLGPWKDLAWSSSNVHRPDLVWVVARGFLLREIEVAGCKLAHTVLPPDLSTAGLFLPVSKADVGGCGILRMRICTHEAEPNGGFILRCLRFAQAGSFNGGAC